MRRPCRPRQEACRILSQPTRCVGLQDRFDTHFFRSPPANAGLAIEAADITLVSGSLTGW
ncbi:MAG TPA: hypothetical protein VGD83_16305 [Streptosporangiaceae bacterium]